MPVRVFYSYTGERKVQRIVPVVEDGVIRDVSVRTVATEKTKVYGKRTFGTEDEAREWIAEMLEKYGDFEFRIEKR